MKGKFFQRFGPTLFLIVVLLQLFSGVALAQSTKTESRQENTDRVCMLPMIPNQISLRPGPAVNVLDIVAPVEGIDYATLYQNNVIFIEVEYIDTGNDKVVATPLSRTRFEVDPNTINSINWKGESYFIGNSWCV